MVDVGQRSPSTPPRARREAGERAVAQDAARSLDPWEVFAATYEPGSFGREATPATVRREANLLQRILAGALSILNEGQVIPRPFHDQREEETTCGLCYGQAA
jgi:hypothetical protein